jgi:hypothetical protein
MMYVILNVIKPTFGLFWLDAFVRMCCCLRQIGVKQSGATSSGDGVFGAIRVIGRRLAFTQ